MTNKLKQNIQRIPVSFAKYIISGVSSLAADYVTFLLLLYVFNLSLKVSVLVGLIVGLILNFVMNKAWSFKPKDGTSQRTQIQLALYLLLFTLNYIFTYCLVYMAENNGIPAYISKILSTACITSWNYFIYKRAIFMTHTNE